MGIIGKLFGVFLQIGLFSIGGGYAVIGLIQDKIVGRYGWLTEKTFGEIITISQMTPGPLAVNASTFAGFQLAGTGGAAAATAGCVAGGIVLSLLLYVFFRKKGGSFYMTQLLKGLKAASTGLILSAAGTIVLLTFWGSSDITQLSWREIDVCSVVLFVSALLLPRIVVPLVTKGKGKGLGPVALMLLTGAAGFFLYR